jgi:hypothetical protein
MGLVRVKQSTHAQDRKKKRAHHYPTRELVMSSSCVTVESLVSRVPSTSPPRVSVVQPGRLGASEPGLLARYVPVDHGLPRGLILPL